jgi:hypothetical protein
MTTSCISWSYFDSVRSVAVSKKVGIRERGICLFVSNPWIDKLVSQIGSDDSFYVITLFFRRRYGLKAYLKTRNLRIYSKPK